MKQYSVVIAVGELGKPVVDEAAMEVVGLYTESIILKVELDPDDLIKMIYINTGDLAAFGLDLEAVDPGIYRMAFEVSDIQKATISLDCDNEFEEEGPEISNLSLAPASWPVEDSPVEEEQSIIDLNI